MKQKNDSLERIERYLLMIMQRMDKAGFYDYLMYIGDTRRFIKRNLLAGLMRGLGAAIGFSILGAIIILLLRGLAESSIPYIADIITQIIDIIDQNNCR